MELELNRFSLSGCYAHWHTINKKTRRIAVCGHLVFDDRRYQGVELASWVNTVLMARGANHVELLRQTSGNWSLVVDTPETVFAAVDRLRSYPLAYQVVSGELRLSDCIWDAAIERNGFDQTGVESFLWSGYPTGERTLYQDVHQLEAGCFLAFQKGQGRARTTCYYQFRPCLAASETGVGELSEELAYLLDQSIGRIAPSIKRNIVLPLSGGMDSRVIAALLKRRNYKNVTCITYGIAENPESKISQEIARQLDYRWHFIEYSPQTWKRAVESAEHETYLRFSSNGCSTPVHTNWDAVRRLLSHGITHQDDIYLPGHAGDFISGSHIPIKAADAGPVTRRTIADWLLQRHHRVWPGPPPKRLSDAVDGYLAQFGTTPSLPAPEAVGLFEYWDMINRQSKFIMNSVRIYEYFGHGWAAPLWDSKLADFFLKVPFDLRHQRKLFFKTSVDHIFKDACVGLRDIPLAGIEPSSPAHRLEMMDQPPVKKSIPARLIAKCVGKFKGPTPPLNVRNLSLSDTFAYGEDPSRLTIEACLSRIIGERAMATPELRSILPYRDAPLDRTTPLGLLNLYAFLKIAGS